MSNPLKCKKCKDVPEMYMVHNRVWQEAELKPTDDCCINCLQKTLKRKLEEDDFQDCLCNIDFCSTTFKAAMCFKAGMDAIRTANPHATIEQLAYITANLLMITLPLEGI